LNSPPAAITPARKKLLITGANGFVAKNIITELLSTADPYFTNHYQYYSRIYAIDVCPGENISRYFDYSSRVIPIQLDLTAILDDKSLSYRAVRDLLFEVDCVIHTAAIVDTREAEVIKKRLERINIDVMDKLLNLANACGVNRFLHMSSASACNERNPNIQIPWYLKLLRNSLFTSLQYSSYAMTKRMTETKVKEFIYRTNGQEMNVLMIRPHTVWGKGDPLGTEVMLQWKSKIFPVPFIGDPDSQVVSVHVRTLARYILLADISLRHHSPQGQEQTNTTELFNGQILNIGEEYVTLEELHRQIVSTQGNGRYQPSDLIESFIPKLWKLPHFISTAIILSVQLLDWLTNYRSPQAFYRLVTANNLGYTYKGLVGNQEYVDTFRKHGELLYETARKIMKSVNSTFPPLANTTTKAKDETMDQWLTNTPISNDLSRKTIAEKRFQSLSSQEKYQLISSHPIAESWNCGPITLRNRVIKAATYECMCSPEDGVPTEQLIQFHRAAAAGGIALTIVAYASVSFDGRSFPTQICLANDPKNSRLQDIHDRTKMMLRRLTNEVHDQGGKACIQITHAGAFNDASTNLRSTSEPPRGPSVILNPLTLKLSKSLENDEESLKRIEEDFAKATAICAEVGFDAIELHLGHGYLLSQFLSRRTNPLHADNPAERLSFPLRVLKRVLAVAHGEDRSYLPNGMTFHPLAVLVKFNVSELTEEDLPLSDVRYFARAFLDAGADLLVPSGGHVMVNGLHMLRGRAPVPEMAAAQKNWWKSFLLKILGSYLIPEEPYREAFFLDRVLSVCYGAGIPLNKVCLIGGLHDEFTLLRATGKLYERETSEQAGDGGGYGFAAVQMGRMLLADPNYCLKVGIAGSSRDMNHHQVGHSYACQSLNICNNSNACIVGATMALKPLRCTEFHTNSW
jgi:2,4-dienoyl-CoA reductase-like NADH-dependent reductase (Old Yellow Enzyme family)/nucleoside-diphosphate-sugar epimerase